MNILRIIEIIFLVPCREAPDIFRPILQLTARQRAAGAVRSYAWSVILHGLIISLGSGRW